MNSKSRFFSLHSVIQYLWIGPPVTKIGEEAEIDTAGPAKMAEKLIKKGLNETIVFYCLDKHVSHFSQVFLQYPNIAVRSIDVLFKNSITDQSEEFLKKAKKIFDEDKKGDVRSRVDAKNLASLMLLYLKGGYYLDTTVFPEAKALNFPVYDSLVVPVFPEDRCNRLVTYRSKNEDLILPFFQEEDGSPESRFAELLPEDYVRLNKTSRQHMIDVFAMFSPKNDNSVARAIKTYVQFFPILQDVKKSNAEKKDEDDDEIADVSVSLIDSAINNGYFGSNPANRRAWLSPYIVTEDGQVRRLLNDIGCYKVFGGSHVKNEPQSMPFSF